MESARAAWTTVLAAYTGAQTPAKLGTAYRNWPRQVLRTATIPAILAGVFSPTQ